MQKKDWRWFCIEGVRVYIKRPTTLINKQQVVIMKRCHLE